MGSSVSAYPNVQVLLLTGDLVSLEHWQSIYKLSVGSEKIGRYFSLKESRFQRDIEEFGGLVINAPLMLVMDTFRELWGKSVICSSYNRNEFKQQALLAEPGTKGLRAQVSPHVAKMAVDLDMTTRLDVIDAIPIIKVAAYKVTMRVRIGHLQYLEMSEKVERETGDKNTWTFVHIDVCPEFYATGMAFHNQPHPEPWERVTEW